jgi:hypothetical protein
VAALHGAADGADVDRRRRHRLQNTTDHGLPIAFVMFTAAIQRLYRWSKRCAARRSAGGEGHCAWAGQIGKFRQCRVVLATYLRRDPPVAARPALTQPPRPGAANRACLAAALLSPVTTQDWIGR